MADLAERATEGEFDNYESSWPLPTVMLIRELSSRKKFEFINRVTAGEFDNTKEEALAWQNSPEGRATFGTIRG